jgi:hypothetical protein
MLAGWKVELSSAPEVVLDLRTGRATVVPERPWD